MVQTLGTLTCYWTSSLSGRVIAIFFIIFALLLDCRPKPGVFLPPYLLLESKQPCTRDTEIFSIVPVVVPIGIQPKPGLTHGITHLSVVGQLHATQNVLNAEVVAVSNMNSQ